VSEELQREVEFYRNVLERSPDAFMVVDADGVIHLANEQCERLFGYTRFELIGQNVEIMRSCARRNIASPQPGPWAPCAI
jgi:PAS domain S-box-containing protein